VKVFLSSTFRDLIRERKAVLDALQRRQQSFAAMEYFLATPKTPLATCLDELRKSDVVVIVVGLRSGSLLPDGSMTYTLAEFEQARHDRQPILGFIKNRWRNAETSPDKVDTLNRLKAGVDSLATTTTFTTVDNLALKVIQSLEAWESEGRPGAQKTFISSTEYFGETAPQFPSSLLDYSTTLVGRTNEISKLYQFLASKDKNICVLSGRGGIGKSRLLQDWSRSAAGWQVVFLKYVPLWHQDSEKEIPTGPTVIVIDDAHRAEIEQEIARVAQLFAARRIRQPLKLLFSTRPGVSSSFLRSLRRMISEAEIEELPELEELTDDPSENLAREVLGRSHSGHAKALSKIAGNSPLVIVAGGRLIAAGKVDLAQLSSFAEFRKAIFDRFLGELRLEGPDFAIDPPRPLLNLIAAVGPVDVRSEHFLAGAQKFLGATGDEVLRTVRLLGERGILSRSEKAVRLLPDVLSDFVLEDCCVDANGPTGYADRVFDVFGSFFFQQLVQNLAELDWRVGRPEYGLSLLDGIWTRIEREFLEGDPNTRRRILEGLLPSAVFQPQRALRLIHLARTTPVVEVEPTYRRLLGDGRKYVMGVVPRLLDATAHNIDYLRRSMDVLWDIARTEDVHDNSDESARRVLKRLASYELNRWAGFNFAVLLNCIRLCERPGAFQSSFTPLDVIDQILEREGEYTEFDGNTFRFGGFGLNYAVVGLMRDNAIDFLGSLLDDGSDRVAVRAAHSIERLLHQYLNRVGRESTDDEVSWQNRERLRCLDLLAGRLQRTPLSLPVRSEIYDAIRSATGFNYTEPVRTASSELLPAISRDCDLAIFDALSRREGDLPLRNRDNPAGTWQEDYGALIEEAHGCLVALPADLRVAKLVDFVKTAHTGGIEDRGFTPIVHSFRDDAGFIAGLIDRLLLDPDARALINELAYTLDALHSYAPVEYRRRAWHALSEGPAHFLVAASSALRVFRENATDEDAALIRRYMDVPNAHVKRHALFAVAYMGGNTPIVPQLLDAALSVDIGTDQTLADALTDAFGPYGVPLSNLSEETTIVLLAKFLPFEDFDVRQGAIPRFLSRLTTIFPDQVLEFLIQRIQIEESRRRAHEWHYRALGIDHHAISFMSSPNERKPAMLRRCLSVRMDLQHSGDTLAKLFWDIDPVGEYSFQSIIEALESTDAGQAAKVADVVRHARRPDEYIYGELRRLSAGLPEGSCAKTIIDRWWDLAEERRRERAGAIEF
jgi:Domain of unknown function (DUF4062)/AAA ATPase domain